MKNILFDLDGTLADPYKAIKSSLVDAFNKHQLPIPPDSEFRKCIGPPIHVSLDKILGVRLDLIPQIVADYRTHHAEHCVSEYEIYDGAEKALSILAKQYKLFVATSKPHVFAKPILKHFGIDHYFHEIYGSELNGVNSTKTELIQYILNKESLNPSETLMIGDREHDAIGAKNNSVPAMGVLWGFGDIEELIASGTQYQVRTWDELVRIIQTL